MGFRANDEKGMTVPEIESSFNIIIVAGTPFPLPLLYLSPPLPIFLSAPLLHSHLPPTNPSPPHPRLRNNSNPPLRRALPPPHHPHHPLPPPHRAPHRLPPHRPHNILLSAKPPLPKRRARRIPARLSPLRLRASPRRAARRRRRVRGGAAAGDECGRGDAGGGDVE